MSAVVKQFPVPVSVDALVAQFKSRRARIGVIGLGYVGLPLVRATAERGFGVLGFDIDPAKIDILNGGGSYIRHIPAAAIADLRQTGRFEATTDFSRVAEVDAILLCVPTPLTKQREPDLTYVVRTTGDPAALSGPVRQIVAAPDPQLPLYELRPLDEYVAGARASSINPLDAIRTE